MKTIYLSYKKIKAELINVARKSPDNRYCPDDDMYYCSYNGPPTKNGEVIKGYEKQCGCIFGTALRNLGIVIGNNAYIIDALDEVGVPKDESLVDLFIEVQVLNDGGAKWNTILKRLT